jgi:dipeptidyl aminopeptidase/acylaminoacyl peptidase
MAALAAAADYSDKIRAATDICGPANLVTFLQPTAAYRQDLRRVEYGANVIQRCALSSKKSRPQQCQGKKHLFVVQGKNDPIVPLRESEAIVADLRKDGTPVWHLMAQDERHGFSKKINSDFEFYVTLLFMKENERVFIEVVR